MKRNDETRLLFRFRWVDEIVGVSRKSGVSTLQSAWKKSGRKDSVNLLGKKHTKDDSVKGENKKARADGGSSLKILLLLFYNCRPRLDTQRLCSTSAKQRDSIHIARRTGGSKKKKRPPSAPEGFHNTEGYSRPAEEQLWDRGQCAFL